MTLERLATSSRHRATHAHTQEEIEARAGASAKGTGIVVWSTGTPWWYILADEEERLPYSNAFGIPVDPLGAPLVQHDDATEFIASAKSNPGHYGKHGLAAFFAAYHGNVTVRRAGGEVVPTAFSCWDQYNDLLDMEGGS